MKCPLAVDNVMVYEGETIFKRGDCLKEECAWWLPQGNCCSIASLAIDLGELMSFTEDIRDKMPHQGQFTR